MNTAQIGGIVSGAQNMVNQITIKQVQNGFIISNYYGVVNVANTLEEAFSITEFMLKCAEPKEVEESK